MAAPIDFLFDPLTGDIRIENGDLVVGDSTRQHQYDLVVAEKGHYKHEPRMGVGLRNYLNDADALPGLTTSIRLELQADGQTVQSVAIQAGGKLAITATFDV